MTNISTTINFDSLAQETLTHLQALIRLDTSNPPGNESLAARYIAGVLDAAGIPYTLLERTPNRANLIARLHGDGSEAPLLLMGHTDVVPAEPERWTHPPFAAEIADGYVWGRGTLDMKFMVAYELAVFLALHREGVPMRRDLILAATADEEISQGNGIDWIALEHPDAIRAEYAINELGAMTSWIAGKPVYSIQVGEKGVCWLELTLNGTPGHASIPRRDNPVGRMAAQVARLASRIPPLHISETMRAYLTGIAGILELDVETLIQCIHDLSLPNPALDRFPDDERRTLHAMTHNTATPTGFTAGYKTNVIPSMATAVIDGRSLPGFDTAAFLAELQPDLDPALYIRLTSEAPPLETPYQTPLFAQMKQTLERLHPGAVALPVMATVATDAKFVAPLGIKVYGFSPVRIEPGAAGAELIHGHDERISLAGLAFGVRALYEVVREFVGKSIQSSQI